MDQTPDLHTAINEIRDGIALRARHPASWADNPLGHVPPQLQAIGFDHRDFSTGVGSYHQKFQVVRRTPDALRNRVIGYLGGVDINQGRLDTLGSPRQRLDPARSPFAATVGAGVPRRARQDHRPRRRRRRPHVPASLGVRHVAATGRRSRAPAGIPAPDATRRQTRCRRSPLVTSCRSCRSGYAPDAGGGSVPLPWSPFGEATIPQGFVNAINNAREFIYIEDQYFTPHDEYVHALLEASVRNDSIRLVIVIPSNADNLFGDIRRRELFERLRDDPDSPRGWGDRLIVGAPMRRPVLADAGRIASRGRLVLQQALAANGDTSCSARARGSHPRCRSGCRSRASGCSPSSATRTSLSTTCRAGATSSAAPAVPSRCGAGRRGPTCKRAPVTLAQETGIYVHTKAMIVDDVFVGVGSCNANRRGFFHDGEITAFAVPEQLKAAPENPAPALRCALWAEHLGIPPSMGPRAARRPGRRGRPVPPPDPGRQPAEHVRRARASSQSSGCSTARPRRG